MGGRGGVKYNRYFGRNNRNSPNHSNSNHKASGRGGGRERWEGHIANPLSSQSTSQGRDNRDNFTVHQGSFKISEIYSMPEWNSRIQQPKDAPKRKYALCLGYLGTEYQGLQINPGAITIEAILEKALFLTGGIDENNFGNIQKVSWSRTARTDKGVHAVSQCCSMKLQFPLGEEENFRMALNNFLPEDIRVHYIQKVSKT